MMQKQKQAIVFKDQSNEIVNFKRIEKKKKKKKKKNPKKKKKISKTSWQRLALCAHVATIDQTTPQRCHSNKLCA
jgi:hypothetical protein